MNGRSTVTQLLETLEHWSRHLDSGLGADAKYLNFQKAFDSVPHQRFLKNVKSYGVCEYVYKWIESFPKKNASKKLSWMGPNQTGPTSRVGSPMEAYLGQYFFYNFHQLHARRNSLPNTIICRRCKAFPPRHNRRRLQADTRRLGQTATMGYKMATEISSSCVVLRAGRGHPDFTYFMWGGNERVKLAKSLCEKDLGIFVDNTLKFENHITTIAKKGNQMAGLLWRTFEYIDEKMFLALYKTMMRYHIEYAAPVWSLQTWKLAEVLEKV